LQVPDPVGIGGRKNLDLVAALQPQLFCVRGVDDDAVFRHGVGQVLVADGARLGHAYVPLGDQVQIVPLGLFQRFPVQSVGDRYVAAHAMVGLACEGILALGGLLLVEVDLLAPLVGHVVPLVGGFLAVEAATPIEQVDHLLPVGAGNSFPALGIEDVFGQVLARLEKDLHLGVRGVRHRLLAVGGDVGHHADVEIIGATEILTRPKAVLAVTGEPQLLGQGQPDRLVADRLWLAEDRHHFIG